MMKKNHIETKLAQRFDETDPAQDKNTNFADIFIDGYSLYQRLKSYDMVTAFGWGGDEQQKLMIDYFLLKKPFELMYHRYPILVCPWCGDLDCGYISLNIEKEKDIVTWSNFILERNNTRIQTGPYHFQWDNYKNAIEHTYRLAGIQ